MVSRWTRVKNPDFLLTLARHNRSTDAGFMIEAISDIKRDAPHYKKVASLISLHPSVENASLPNFYRRLGALIMPSYFETYGNVAQEALATGTPVLVSEQTGFAETLRDVGLDDWVADFTCPAEVLARIEDIVAAGVPHAAWSQLRERYTNAPVFTAYTRVLSGH
ncbi:MAG: glycosyltransferase [Candidatus Paceibacterota bacterium]